MYSEKELSYRIKNINTFLHTSHAKTGALINVFSKDGE